MTSSDHSILIEKKVFMGSYNFVLIPASFQFADWRIFSAHTIAHI